MFLRIMGFQVEIKSIKVGTKGFFSKISHEVRVLFLILINFFVIRDIYAIIVI